MLVINYYQALGYLPHENLLLVYGQAFAEGNTWKHRAYSYNKVTKRWTYYPSIPQNPNALFNHGVMVAPSFASC